jgi:hypothetical protein
MDPAILPDGHEHEPFFTFHSALFHEFSRENDRAGRRGNHFVLDAEKRMRQNSPVGE